MTEELELRYWRAVAALPVERRHALAELEACFGAAAPPDRLDGPTHGRLLTTTFGYGLDAVTQGLTSLWMPWKGKVFDAEAKEGRNIFTPGFRFPLRMLWPAVRPEEAGPDRLHTFRFATWSGESASQSGVQVFKIDYDLPESPGFLIRDILDELVMVGEGLYLGQALLRWKGAYRRAAWFQLQTPTA